MAGDMSEWAKLSGGLKPHDTSYSMPAKTALVDRIDELVGSNPTVVAEFVPPKDAKKLGKRAIEKARLAWEVEQKQLALNKAMGREACAQCNQPAETKEQRKARLEHIMSGDYTDPARLDELYAEPDLDSLDKRMQNCEDLLKEFEGLGIGLPHAS